jgi:aldose 1-epimerase
MAFQVREENRPAPAGQDGTVLVLEEAGGQARAEVWPANGFNCYRWQVAHAGVTQDLLYADPQFFQGAKPTRSGIPILFPFPNRIRDGRFTWAGRTYELPLNDPGGKNAIHGFACRRPWRVVSRGADAASAWVTGEFVGSRDAPEALSLWPADYLLRVTFRLEARALRITAQVENPDQVGLPFGLGYHPYFRMPLLHGDKPEDSLVQAAAEQLWVLSDSLPRGDLAPVDAARDLRRPRRFGDLTLDDVLRVDQAAPPAAGLLHLGSLHQSGTGKEILRLESSPAFRELVVFTPPHRQAVCLEPYTCTTDAINLEQRGLDAGLRTLQLGERWQGEVVVTFLPRPLAP